MVKGCYHPEDGVIAIPRVHEGRKMKRLSEAMNIVERYYSFMKRYVPEIGEVAPVVPVDWIAEIKHVSQKPCSDLLTPLHEKCRELINILRERCGLECDVSGSLLGGYWREGSDIDLICEETGGPAGSCLRRLRSEGILNPMLPAVFEKEIHEVSEVVSEDYMRRLAASRLTQGVFEGFPYTIRILNCRGEEPYLGPYLWRMNGDFLIRVDSLSYTTPSIYEVTVIRPHLRTGLRTVLLSYRVRMAELAEGTVIAGKGVLKVGEKVSVLSFDTPDSRVYWVVK